MGFAFLYHVLGSESGQISLQPSLLSLKRHCTLTLSSHIMRCSPLNTLLYWFQSVSVCLVSQSPKIGTELQMHSQNAKQMGIITFPVFLAMILLT